jgi:hypothetical protein
MKRAMRALAPLLIFCASAMAASPSPSATIRGSLDKEVIRGVIRRHLDEVRFCFERELLTKPELKGRVMVQFTIDKTGRVIASHVESTTLHDEPTEKCITDTLLRWEFPQPAGGGTVIVSYPFVLKVEDPPAKK